MIKNIFLVHGFGGNKKEYFKIKKYLLNNFKEINIFEFEYAENYGEIGIEDISEKLKKFIDKNNNNSKENYIIGLSQGGIIASYYLEYLEGYKKFKKIITICSPFNGSILANIGHIFLRQKGIFELKIKSKFLSELKNKIKNSNVKYYSIWNPLDLMVFPGKNGINEYSLENLKVYSIIHPATFSNKKSLEFIKTILK